VLAGALLAIVLGVVAWSVRAFREPEITQPSKAVPSAPVLSTALDYGALIDDENFQVLLGMAYGKAGRIDEAMVHQREAIRINPRSLFALNNLGYYLFLKGNYAESATVLEQALQIDSQSELARNNLRQTYASALAAAQTHKERASWQDRERALEHLGSSAARKATPSAR
jgi:tetratricopeptide (TPR) repeat protein